MEPILRFADRALFVLAGMGLILALAEGLIGLTGRSLVGHAYSAGRLLEISTMIMVFVIGLRIRPSRD